MALNAATVWEVRTAGNDTNGGGYDATQVGGVDQSLQDSKNTVGNNISTTDAVANGTTTLTSATASFTADIIGNIIYLQGGTGSLAATRRRVVTRTNATTITVDATVASGNTITMNIGGALASPGGAAVNWVSGNLAWIKAGTYTITSASANVAAGCFSRTGFVFGYQTSRGDWGTKPLLQASGISSFALLTMGASPGFVKNIAVDGASLTTSRGIVLTSGTAAVDCKASNCTNNGFNNSGGLCIQCEATGCATNAAFSGTGSCYNCWSHDNTVGGFSITAAGALVQCIADTNTGATTDGFTVSAAGGIIISCVSYANGRDGFRSTASGVFITNCIAESNSSGVGFNNNTATNVLSLTNCGAFGNNTDFSIGTNSISTNDDQVVGSSSFFTNPTASDFSLNNTAGAGADLRAVGYPQSLASGNTISFPDIGAAQHQETVGGGEHSAVF